MTRHGPEDPPSELQALDDIYALYESFSKDLSVACRRGCCVCCTQDVTMTTLEGRHICRALRRTADTDMESVTRAIRHHVPTSPGPMSTNAFVRRCLEDRDPPEEDRSSVRTSCLFLSGEECVIYADRPFGCRSFFSTQPCRPEGSAVMDPFWLTVNAVFLQFIEDLDIGGFFGPINSVLSFLMEKDPLGMPISPTDRQHVGRTQLAGNIPIPALMVPPEHEERIQPMIRKLRAIRQKHRPQGLAP